MRLGLSVSADRLSLPASVAAGLAAGSAFLVVELAARVALGVPTLPELIQDRLVQTLPGPAFAYLLEHLLYLGKPSLFAGLLTLQLVLAAGFGAVANRLGRPAEVAVGLWLATGLVVLPLAGKGAFAGQTSVATTTLGAYAVYALALVACWRWTSAPRLAELPGPIRAGTRLVTRREAFGAAVFLVAAAVLARRAIGNLPSLPARTASGLPDPVTSPDDFYLVSKNIIDPDVNGTAWRLRVDGLVSQPLTLTYEDLIGMPGQEFYRTLECISNPVGGPLISNGRWTGVRLADVLQQAGVQPDAKVLRFTSQDGYTENMPLEKALSPDSYLVYQLGGQPLPRKHGFPVRVLGAGTYGMKNPKWLTRIEVAPSGTDGFWEQQGWDPDASVQTTSRIDSPPKSSEPAGSVTFQGIAYAGDRGVQQVELSLDGGHSWQPAELQAALGRQTWVFWQQQVDLRPGSYEAVVRATDGASQPQNGFDADTYPSGATGYHRVRLHVV